MRIAVITPYFSESHDQLVRCISSVSSQSINIEHFLIADGRPQTGIEKLGVRHILLDRNHNDFGNTPRAVGGLIAVSEGYNFIGFLDADNWWNIDHISTCLETLERTAELPDYLVCKRKWVRLDGSILPYEAEEDMSGAHVDTNCIVLLPGSLHSVARWGLIPREISSIGDRIFLSGLRSENLTFCKNSHATVNYLCTWANVFQQINEPPPFYAKADPNIREIFEWLKKISPKERAFLERKIGFKFKF